MNSERASDVIRRGRARLAASAIRFAVRALAEYRAAHDAWLVADARWFSSRRAADHEAARDAKAEAHEAAEVTIDALTVLARARVWELGLDLDALVEAERAGDLDSLLTASLSVAGGQ